MTNPLGQGVEALGAALEEAIVVTGTLNQARQQFERIMHLVARVGHANPSPTIGAILTGALGAMTDLKETTDKATKIQAELHTAIERMRQIGDSR